MSTVTTSSAAPTSPPSLPPDLPPDGIDFRVDSARSVTVPPVIAVRDLKTAFGSHVVHEHLNFTVYPGEIMALVGGSGSGKTTLLRQIIGLDQPASGVISVFGRQLNQLSPQEHITMSRRWGMLFQSGALFSALTVFDNCALPLRELGVFSPTLISEVVMCRLSMVGLSCEDAGKLPADLSGGMVKRVALARTLALDPELLFLDEPTAGLDPERSDEFVKLVSDLHAQLRFTVVMVTHDLDTLADLATHVAVLADRHVIAQGTPGQIAQIDHPFIKTFFQGPRGMRALSARIARDTPNGKP